MTAKYKSVMKSAAEDRQKIIFAYTEKTLTLVDSLSRFCS